MKTAMILAAGRGERLKPLTNIKPKAMCLVQQKPIIEHHVTRLAKAGFERIVINHAYLGNQIRRYLGNGATWGIEICYVPEPPGGLETGGGIYNALPLLGTKPFITVNADVFTDYDYDLLKIKKNILAHLVLVDNPLHNQNGDYDLDGQHQLNNNRRYTYAGIAYYWPEAFEHSEIGRYSVTPLVRYLAGKNLATGEIHQGIWIDIGSAERLQFADSLTKPTRRSKHTG